MKLADNNEMNTTKGEWSAHPVGETMRSKYSQPLGVIVAKDKQLICGCFGDTRGGIEATEANAQLIALAGNLNQRYHLNVLKEAVGVLYQKWEEGFNDLHLEVEKFLEAVDSDFPTNRDLNAERRRENSE